MSAVLRTAIALAGVLVVVAAPAGARRRVPPVVELDGCVLPSDACEPKLDVVELVVDGEKRRFAVETLRYVTIRGGSGERTLTELRLRGLRVNGPKQLTSKILPGARQRLRGVLELAVGYLLLQGVDPLPPVTRGPSAPSERDP
jgi:hypothetical protein